MKKKKGWIYALVCVVLITAIVLIITLYPKAKDKNPDTDLKSTSVSITLNTPQTINIFKGNTAEIPSSLIVVKPESKTSELTYEIVVLSGGTANGITFENNLITANYVGEYAIKFKVSKNETDFVSKQQKVIVHEDESLCHVKQIATEFYATDQVNINTIFAFSSTLNYEVTTSAGLTINQNRLIATTAGKYDIKFTFTDEGIKYFYTNDIEVKENVLPQYNISVIGVENNTYTMQLSNFSHMFGYLVTMSGNSSGINQSAKATSDNNNVATAEVMGEGLLYVQATGKGEANITLTYLQDNTVTYTFKVIIM